MSLVALNHRMCHDDFNVRSGITFRTMWNSLITVQISPESFHSWGLDLGMFLLWSRCASWVPPPPGWHWTVHFTNKPYMESRQLTFISSCITIPAGQTPLSVVTLTVGWKSDDKHFVVKLFGLHSTWRVNSNLQTWKFSLKWTLDSAQQ